jgi:ABC-type sugar transport system ATPase subunit
MEIKTSVKDVSFDYGIQKVLKGISMEFPKNKLTVLVGPSGCGKTTLLRCIAGLEKKFEGHIFDDGKNILDISPKERNVSMVFQDFALYSTLSAKENITIALKAARIPKVEIAQRLKEISKYLDIDDILNKRINTLSGGEKQRIAVARSMIRNPSLLLLDEPFANLDASLKKNIKREFKNLLEKFQITSILVTHDQNEAAEMADLIAVMDNGRILQTGTATQLYYKPRTLFVAEFIGNPPINLLSGHIFGELKREYPKTKTLALRPDNIRVSPIHNNTEDGLTKIFLVGKLVSRVFVPPNFILRFIIVGSEIEILVLSRENSEMIETQSEYKLEFQKKHLHHFDNDGLRIQEYD